MKVVIFAGGKGTRISEEAHLKPKPMIEVGGTPILWHIMKIYAAYVHTEFIICCGYKGYMIKEYCYHYFLHNSDMTFDLSNNEMTVHTTNAENIKVTLVDTGLETMTAGRLKRVQEYVGNERFMLTYGDGVCDIDMEAQLKFHESNGAAVTMSIVQPGSRFGMIELDENNRVSEFTEKPQEDGAWINGGFFICEPKAFEYLPDQADDVMWERSPLEKLTADGELAAYRHHGFWKCMDTLRDNVDLNDMWDDKPKWKNW
ncbi:MAG: glucose-1-phosphate cytidylyltransferase [Bacteroidetes bacterium]|nr:glucose-1-phosphate cytidylyltransferase [Bacteroidota bacterium]